MSEIDSVGESTVLSTGHRSIRGASIASETSLAARLTNFKFSFAYQNGLTKQKCGLCQMYYRKESVSYTVPNHRIFDLQNEWFEKQKSPVKRNGRRYQSASFLYTETTVCTFCSQFFCLLADDRRERLRTGETQRRPSSNGPKLSILTPLIRTDVAEHQRCYQSSEVDGKTASWAITPPYDVHSRTRREADPWWEIEFGRTCSFDDISFQITIHVRQNFEIYVMLFDHPVGFDDPFLDHIINSTSTVSSKVIQFTAQDEKRNEMITWPIFAENDKNLLKSKGYAIRIQLRGIHILELSHFQARLGDELIMQTELDSALSVNSFSSFNPIIMKEELREMLPPEQRLRERIGTADPHNNTSKTNARIDRNQIHFQSETAVKSLSHHIEVRYDTISEWKQRVLNHTRIFTEEEIGVLYKVIFKSTSEFNRANKESSAAIASAWHEQDLLDAALLEHYPRCDLQELHQRIRSVVRWIQSRSHLKMLGSLMQNDHLNSLAVNPNEALYQLNSAFKRIEHYWDKKEKYEQMYSFLDRKDSKHIHIKVNEIRGCSWSQFLIILHLFCVGKCEDIPKLAYNIENPHVPNSSRIGDDLVSTYSYQSGDGQSAGSFSVSLPPQIQKKLQKEPKNNNHRGSLSLMSSSEFGGGGINELGGQGSWISSGGGGFTAFPFSPSTSSLHLPKSSSASKIMIQPENSLTLSVRQQEGGKYTPFDSRFSEYKLQHLRRKLGREMVFPKQLSLEFARQLNPRRATIAQGNIMMDDNDPMQQQLLLDATQTGSEDAWDTMSKTSNDTSFDGLASPSSRPTLTRGQSYKLPPIQMMVRTTSKLSALITDGSLPMDASSAPVVGLKHASHSMGKSTRSILSEGGTGSRAPSRGGGLMYGSSTHRDLMATLSESSLHGKINRNGINTASSYASSSHLSPPSPIMQQKSNATKPAASLSIKFKPSTATLSKAHTKDDDSYDDEDGSASQTSSTTKKSHKIKAIDFHRVCALCELRLPRDSVQIKVIRKHIVTLKSSWDPKLVSKDVRSLDNTISMYNLVYVCVFCAQYFDPDCPGGIAFPVRVEADVHNQKKKAVDEVEEEDFTMSSVLDSINERKISTPMNPFYDTRYISNNIDVGEVFKRPATMESRKRAQRALEVSRLMSSRGKTDSAAENTGGEEEN